MPGLSGLSNRKGKQDSELIWYAKNITVKNGIWFEMGRAGVWYTDHITVEDSAIEAPKNFRRCQDVTLRNVSFSNAAETLWSCDRVLLDHAMAKGDYFAMNGEHMEIHNFRRISGVECKESDACQLYN